MNVGNLNKRITIQIREERKDENGFTINEWLDFKTVYSSIKNLYGKEFLQAQALNSKASKKIKIRYIKELDNSINKDSSIEYRVVYKNIIYNILYIDNINEANKYMEIMLEGE
ncbi:phage head closure protein [Clostridioides difficile]|uniref:phage head closure protein n=1 Tax=Clostridioides difficile TaxID=1496 RepID=UPI0021CD7EB0|nr:phage head closure protein [Clostridioides difficile]MCU5977962.1 phage head closure protein [Clostridioides difficile]MCU6153094.1 phage head closure protein [Clostridioides difficile]